MCPGYLAHISPTTLSDKATDYIRRIMFNQEMNSEDTRLKVAQARLNLARADNDRLSRGINPDGTSNLEGHGGIQGAILKALTREGAGNELLIQQIAENLSENFKLRYVKQKVDRRMREIKEILAQGGNTRKIVHDKIYPPRQLLAMKKMAM